MPARAAHVIYRVRESQRPRVVVTHPWVLYHNNRVVIHVIHIIHRHVIVCNRQIHGARALAIGKTLVARRCYVGQLRNGDLTSLVNGFNVFVSVVKAI